MAELVQEFVTVLQERVAAIHASVEANDLRALTTLAHQLKGASGGYGFASIGTAAASLESSAKAAKEAAQVAKEVNELIALCQRATADPAPSNS